MGDSLQDLTDRIRELSEWIREIDAELEQYNETKTAREHAQKLLEYAKKERARRSAVLPRSSKQGVNGHNSSARRPDDDYPYKGKMAHKIEYAIRYLDRFVHRSEIEAFMSRKEDVNSNTLSYTLSQMYRTGKIPRAKYGAPQWITYGLPYMIARGLDESVKFSEPKYRPDFEQTALAGADQESETFGMEREMV